MKKVAWVAALLLALIAFGLPGAGLAQGVQPQATVQPSVAPTGAVGACQTFTLTRGADTWIGAQTPGTNYSRDTKLVADGNPASAALIRWVLTTVPAATQITHAFLRVRHVDPGDQSVTVFQIYALRRPWSDSEANWEFANRSMRWTTPGASDRILDRESTSMGETPITMRSPGTVRIDLAEEGVAQVNRWLTGVEPNYGLVVQDYRSGDGFRFASFESRHPPELVLSTCAQPWRAEERLTSATATPVARTTVATATPAARATAARTRTAIATPTATAPSAVARGGLQTLSFQDGSVPDRNYRGTLDTYANQSVPGATYGAARVAWLAGGGPTGMRGNIVALVYWNLADIPPGSEVISATITLNTVVASAGVYNMYEVMRPWDEATLTWASGRDGSWLEPNATGWSETAAVPLGTYRPAAPGQTVIELDDRAVALAQRWVNDPRLNFGLAIANSRAAGPAGFETSEALTVANRPKLTITYR